jgi:hypothetical protein
MMISSMVGMMMMMVPGFEMLGMVLATVVPIFMMLPLAASGVIVALGLLAFGIYKLNEAHAEQTKKARELADATVMSQVGLEKMSEDFGTVSLTEQRKIEQNAKLVGVTEKQITAGQQYITEAESGQKLLAGVKTQQAAGLSSSEIGQNIAANLATAVAQEVISKEQGDSIIAALALMAGDVGIASSGSAQFKAYTKDLAKTSLMTAQDRNIALQNKANFINSKFSKEFQSELSNPFANGLFNPIGYAIKGLRGETAGQNKELRVKQMTEEATNAYGQNVGGIDVINAQYDIKVKEAKTQKEINTLEDERIDKLNEQRIAANLSYEFVKAGKEQLKVWEPLSWFGGGNDNRFLDNIKETFSEDSPQYKTAQEINKLGGEDADFKLRLQTQLESGTLNAESIDVLLGYADRNEGFATNYELMIFTSGETAALEFLAAAKGAGASEYEINAVMKIYADDAEAQSKITRISSTIAELRGQGANIDFSAIDLNNVDGLNKTIKMLDEIDKITADGPITLEAIAKTKGFEGLKADSDWFNGLDEVSQRFFLTYYATIKATMDDADVKKWMMSKQGLKGSRGAMQVTVTDKDRNAYAANEAKKFTKGLDLPTGDGTKTGNDAGSGGGGGTEEDKVLTQLQARLDKQNKALAIIALQEAKINKKYDERKKALEEIAKLNSKIAEQQKSQLDIADALSRGDIAAAARAVQAERARAAAFAQEQQMTSLEEQRKRELSGVEFKGKTREELEKQMADLQMKIAKREYRNASGGGLMRGYAMGGMMKRYSAGGRVMSYFAGGGSPLGSDTIPAMLTPGEFVVKRPAVQNFGVKKLEAINSGSNPSSGVYNYSISVNVSTDADPDQIARAVAQNVKRTDSYRIRGNRL